MSEFVNRIMTTLAHLRELDVSPGRVVINPGDSILLARHLDAIDLLVSSVEGYHDAVNLALKGGYFYLHDVLVTTSLEVPPGGFQVVIRYAPR